MSAEPAVGCNGHRSNCDCMTCVDARWTHRQREHVTEHYDGPEEPTKPLEDIPTEDSDYDDQC